MGKYVDTRLKLQRIYAQIPSFECVPGCTDCCGPIPCSEVELVRIPHKVGSWQDNGISCPHAQKDVGCTIYNRRPFLCRVFGASEDQDLKCPHGRGPAAPINTEKTRELLDRYKQLLVP
jgi:uncharacterized protein